MLKNLKGKILSFAAGIAVACGGMAVAGIVNNEDLTSSGVSSVFDFMDESYNELGWTSVRIVNAKAEDGTEEAETPVLTIESCNINYGAEVSIMFAVSCAEGYSLENMKMLYFKKTPPSAYTYEAYEAIEEQEGEEQTKKNMDNKPGKVDVVKEKDCAVFYYPIMPKKVTEYIYAVAYVEEISETGELIGRKYSNPIKYSILDYAYDKLTAEGISQSTYKLASTFFEYCKAAQERLGDEEEKSKLASDEYYFLRFTEDDCVIVDTDANLLRNKGAYSPTETVTIQAPATNAEGVEFLYWLDQYGNPHGNEAATTFQFKIAEEFEMKEGDFGLELTPVYENPWKTGDYTSSGLIVEAYLGTATKITIPYEIDGKRVLVVGANIFGNNAGKIEEIKMENGVLNIADKAFQNCTSLKRVEIPSSIRNISSQAFLGCLALEEIIVDSANVNYGNNINDGHLYAKDSNGDVVALVQYATAKVEEDNAYYVPETVVTIGENAFRNAGKLKEIYIHANVNLIGSLAFKNISDDCIIYYANESVFAEGIFEVPEAWATSGINSSNVRFWNKEEN